MSNAKTIIIASNNAHKAEEIAHALDFPGWEFRTLKEAHIDSDPAEDADSFLGNARIKAKAAWEAAKETLGHPVAVLADDSGLEVDALDGAPVGGKRPELAEAIRVQIHREFSEFTAR